MVHLRFPSTTCRPRRQHRQRRQRARVHRRHLAHPPQHSRSGQRHRSHQHKRHLHPVRLRERRQIRVQSLPQDQRARRRHTLARDLDQALAHLLRRLLRRQRPLALTIVVLQRLSLLSVMDLLAPLHLTCWRPAPDGLHLSLARVARLMCQLIAYPRLRLVSISDQTCSSEET